MRQKFGLVGRHVDVDRAISLAAFAGQTQIQRLFDMLVAPAVFEWLSLEHFKEQTRPPTRGVGFFVCDHIAGTHGPASRAAALAYTDTAQARSGKTATVLWILKVR